MFIFQASKLTIFYNLCKYSAIHNVKFSKQLPVLVNKSLMKAIKTNSLEIHEHDTLCSFLR